MRHHKFTLSLVALVALAATVQAAPPTRNFGGRAAAPTRQVGPFFQSFPAFTIPSGSVTPMNQVSAFPRTIFPPMSSNNPFVSPFVQRHSSFFPTASIPLSSQAILDPATRLSVNSAITQSALNSAFNTQPTISSRFNRFESHALRHAWWNAYLQSLINTGAYGGGGSYGGGGMYGYGAGAGYGSGGYGGANPSYGAAGNYAAGNGNYASGDYGYGSLPSYYSAATSQSAAAATIDVLGFPLENGHLAWPLGLRVLGPSDRTSLLERRIDALLVMLVYQSSSGQLNPTLVAETTRSVKELRGMLDNGATNLPQQTYEDARWFLSQLERSLVVLK